MKKGFEFTLMVVGKCFFLLYIPRPEFVSLKVLMKCLIDDGYNIVVSNIHHLKSNYPLLVVVWRHQ